MKRIISIICLIILIIAILKFTHPDSLFTVPNASYTITNDCPGITFAVPSFIETATAISTINPDSHFESNSFYKFVDGRKTYIAFSKDGFILLVERGTSFYFDLRKGIDGLNSIIKYQYNKEPLEKDTLFLFCGTRRNRIKGVLWTGDRSILLYIRLAEGSFKWPRSVLSKRRTSVLLRKSRKYLKHWKCSYRNGLEKLRGRKGMRADEKRFYESALKMDHESLLSAYVSLHTEHEELLRTKRETDRITTEGVIQFQKLTKDYQDSLIKIEQLEKTIKKLSDQLELKNRAIFGRNTEKFLDTLASSENPPEEFEDESQTEDCDEGNNDSHTIISLDEYRKSLEEGSKGNPEGRKEGKNAGNKKGKGLKRSRLLDSLKSLPSQLIYDLDIDKLNSDYGVGNWRIAMWHEHYVVEKIENPLYVKKDTHSGYFIRPGARDDYHSL